MKSGDLKMDLHDQSKVYYKICKKNKNWMAEEDDKLRELIEKYGTAIWSRIASKLTNRTGKQCKERWYNVLNPSDENREWLFEEDWLLFLYQRLHRSNWSQITKHFQNRNENVLKTHWNSTMKKKIGAYRQRLQEAIYLMKNDQVKFEEEFPEPQFNIIKEILDQNGIQQNQSVDKLFSIDQKIEEPFEKKKFRNEKINFSFLENEESLDQLIELVHHKKLDYAQYVDVLMILEKLEAFSVNKSEQKVTAPILKNLKEAQKISDDLSNEDQNIYLIKKYSLLNCS